MTAAPPKVFISYSHDTIEHQERVLGFADRLRADDQYNAAPPEGWPLWCEQQIAAADVVLRLALLYKTQIERWRRHVLTRKIKVMM
jgi:SEFIR domain